MEKNHTLNLGNVYHSIAIMYKDGASDLGTLAIKLLDINPTNRRLHFQVRYKDVVGRWVADTNRKVEQRLFNEQFLEKTYFFQGNVNTIPSLNEPFLDRPVELATFLQPLYEQRVKDKAIADAIIAEEEAEEEKRKIAEQKHAAKIERVKKAKELQDKQDRFSNL